jgi:uncharacterized protein DUF6894
MPRYFFSIQASNRGIENDPSGTILPDNMAALSHAEHMIRQLQKECGYTDPGLTMLVKDESQQTILFVPFVAGGD